MAANLASLQRRIRRTGAQESSPKTAVPLKSSTSLYRARATTLTGRPMLTVRTGVKGYTGPKGYTFKARDRV
ncbi:hypothetical protein C8J56DRAFT_1052028 [Mycena floridula]|nr:hypothetical protein C8J56DRAFT_1052028 [Mycena floridula]